MIRTRFVIVLSALSKGLTAIVKSVVVLFCARICFDTNCFCAAFLYLYFNQWQTRVILNFAFIIYILKHFLAILRKVIPLRSLCMRVIIIFKKVFKYIFQGEVIIINS